MKKSFVLTHQKKESAPKNSNQNPNSSIKLGSSLAANNKKSVNSKKSITGQIDKLINRIQNANADIAQTEKKLDVDQFLNMQKQKRKQYAKRLNEDYELEKKKRQEKLYNKYNREQKAKLTGGINEKTKTKTGIALEIMKIFQLPVKEIHSILNGHHYNINSEQIISLTKEGIQQQESLIKQSETTFKKIQQVAQNSLQCKIFPIQCQMSHLIVAEQAENLMNALILSCIQLNDEKNQIPIQSPFHSLHYQAYENFILCKFYDNGQRKTVVTIPTIQVREFTHKSVNIYSRLQNGNIFWPSILQKCYKRLKYYYGIKSISQISMLESIYDVYGLDAQILPIWNKNLIIENFPKIMYSLLNDDCLVGFYNENVNSSIYQNRIYPLQQVQNRTIKKKTTQFYFKIFDPWRGKLLSSKVQQYFKVLQLCELFDRMIIVRNYPKKWVQQRIKMSFYSSGGVNSLNNDWTRNPQYLFTVTKNTDLRIIMRRIKDHEEKQTDSINVDRNFGFMLFSNSDVQTHLTCMKIQQLIVKTKSNDLNGASHTMTISKGNYILIPYSNKISGKQYKFYYLDMLMQRQDSINFGKARIVDFYFSQEQSGQKKIQKLQTKEKFEKPKIENVLIPQHHFKKTKEKKQQEVSVENKQKKITKKYLESLGLTINKDVSIQNFYVPGFIAGLIINKETVNTVEKNKKNSVKSQIHHQQLIQCERQQNMSVLIGYDAMSDTINRGKMNNYMAQTEDEVDLANYGLGKEGLVAIMEALMQIPRLQKLNLKNNDLNDQAVTYLCYYLEKANRVELKQLNMSENKAITKQGALALDGLASRLGKVNIIGV